MLVIPPDMVSVPLPVVCRVRPPVAELVMKPVKLRSALPAHLMIPFAAPVPVVVIRRLVVEAVPDVSVLIKVAVFPLLPKVIVPLRGLPGAPKELVAEVFANFATLSVPALTVVVPVKVFAILLIINVPAVPLWFMLRLEPPLITLFVVPNCKVPPVATPIPVAVAREMGLFTTSVPEAPASNNAPLLPTPAPFKMIWFVLLKVPPPKLILKVAPELIVVLEEDPNAATWVKLKVPAVTVVGPE